ncbi:hypothetical protein FPV67DRAFT_1163178 [Lyophyllum atratum]|nr:hypothetical protein FPV67DRAFT_1163178 [Lyophyllum atratum]
MLTRSKAKQLATQPTSWLQTSPPGLRFSGTIVEIAPSATGEGTHKRWIYSNGPAEDESQISDLGMDDMSTAPEYADVVADTVVNQRFITPASTVSQLHPGAPRKSTGGQRDRASTPISPLGKIDEGSLRGIGESQRQRRSSQVRNPVFLVPLALPPLPPAQQFQPPLPPGDTSSSRMSTGRRQALGPTDTLLFNEEGDPIYVHRALGPNGTFLIDDKGEIIYE